MMDFTFSKKQLVLENECINFAAKEISPHIAALESDLDFRTHLFQKMGKKGFFHLILKGDIQAYILALKAIAKADAGIAVAMGVTNMVAEAINHFGNPVQRKKYLSLSGTPASFALTEKNAGSDPKSITTTARLVSDHYIINGEKKFITNADMAGVIILFAKTGRSEISAFLIDKGTEGMSVIKKENKLGLLTANLVALRFDQCRIHKRNLLGKLGEGLKIAFSSLDSGRLGIAAQSIGIAEAAFDAALHFSKKRRQFGHPISDNQAIAFKLADMKVKLSASTLLLFKAASLKEKNLPYTLEASEAKLFASESANEIANEALQIHGGYGYIKDYPAEKYFRDARVTTLYEGTSEIQRIVIARHII